MNSHPCEGKETANKMPCTVIFGRPELPGAFFDEVRRYFHLDGNGRLLDLGCRAGSFLPLAGDVGEILIMDPEPGRLADTLWDAEQRGIDNISLLEKEFEDLHPGMGRFRLAVVQDSILRKDEKRRLSRLAEVTEPEGGIVIVGVRRWGPPNDWEKSVWAVLQNRFGEKRSKKDQTCRRRPSEPQEALWTGSPFRKTMTFTHTWTRKLTIGKAVSEIISTASIFFGPFVEIKKSLVDELRSILRNAGPPGTLQERLRLTAHFARKI